MDDETGDAADAAKRKKTADTAFRVAERMKGKDEEKYLEFMKRAGEAGHAEAQLILYQTYRDRGDFEHKWEWLRKATKSGQPIANFDFFLEMTDNDTTRWNPPKTQTERANQLLRGDTCTNKPSQNQSCD